MNGSDGQTRLGETQNGDSLTDTAFGKVTAKELYALLDRQQYRCALTGRKLTPSCATLDHRTPLSRGGEHDLSNIQILDKQINVAKGTMTQVEFIQVCHEVIEWLADQDE